VKLIFSGGLPFAEINFIEHKRIGIPVISSFTIQKKLQLKSASEKLFLSEGNLFLLY